MGPTNYAPLFLRQDQNLRNLKAEDKDFSSCSHYLLLALSQTWLQLLPLFIDPTNYAPTAFDTTGSNLLMDDFLQKICQPSSTFMKIRSWTLLINDQIINTKGSFRSYWCLYLHVSYISFECHDRCWVVDSKGKVHSWKKRVRIFWNARLTGWRLVLIAPRTCLSAT